MKKEKSIPSFHPYENAIQQSSADSKGNSKRTLFTIKVGAITQWVRDLLAIIVLWKLIFAIP